MEPKQFHRRVLAVVVLLAVMLTAMGTTLYDLQINNGEDYYQQSQYKIVETQNVEAARGQILDRNGQVLVSNEAIYQVKLDTSPMKDDRNDIILELIQVAREEGVEWTDTLPISKSEPFTFTTENPYFTVGEDEEGNETRSLTRLGQLAVRMGWLADDPTQEQEPQTQETTQQKEPGLWDKIKAFFTGGSAQTPSETETAPQQEEQADTLPTAEQLLGLMCRTFEIAGEGAVDEDAAKSSGEEVPALNIGDMDPDDARAVAGVLYELYLRSREITWTEYIFASDVEIDFISQVKERDLTGVEIEATTVRRYHTQYAAHILGRVGPIYQEEWDYYKSIDADGDGTGDYQMDDTVGKEGVEQAFESYLRGTPGRRALERSTEGNIVSETWITEPEPGGNVVLTIDIGLQGQIENILAEALPNLESKEVEGAACVVLDVDSAEVLAAASYPTFSQATYSADYQANLENPLNPLFNRAFQGLYPPGSTFKMITAIAGLESGIITPGTEIEDEGRYTYWSTPQPQCWYYREYGRKHGLVNVSGALEVSCNYFFYDVGHRTGIDTLVEYAQKFGLGQSTGIELPERTGAVGSPARSEELGQTWYEGNVLNVAIGQDNTQVTPLQLANYIATLVNGGTRYAAHLLKEVKSSDFSQILYTYEPQVLSVIDIQPENLEAVKAGMLALTTSGSVSRYFQDLPVQVGAKTGSAQVSAQTESNAVFVCFAPYDDPEIAVAIAVEHGGSGSELGAIAADILKCYFTAQETREEVLTENTLVR